MKLYAPLYYQRFTCIADKCRHSCCVGWEIDVDPRTLKKYRELKSPAGAWIRESICTEDTPHFRLAENERCPHLDERGLCNIIKELGEGYLCDICREHPRFYNDTAQGREVGLGMCCEEACRLILASERYDVLVPVGELPDGELPRTDSVHRRAHAYALLSDASLPYADRLRLLGSAFGASLACRTDGEWQELLSSLEYMDGTHRTLFSTFTADEKTTAEAEGPLERALAYFIFRHGTECVNEKEFSAALGFALFCERLICSLIKAGHGAARAARIVSEELEYSEENTQAIKELFLLP